MSALRTEDSWQVKAACRGPQARVFYPPSAFERKDEKLERERLAKEICETCPVKQPCLEYAMKMRDQHGVWGGLSEAERKRIFEKR